ncbi:alpha/beta hydrolase [Gillisia sp. Hel_I_29]|uniref:alpha/beta hydrolase n=1 Tax=Gillisia sp. Hel_I_29 TaxID=1249975 RepID=UPI0005583EB2|nr:alpha/beta hydrolase [Gillisia sp. Hel_I_29]
MTIKIPYFLLFFILMFSSCAVNKTEDVSYLNKKDAKNLREEPKMNIFSPKKATSKKLPVLIFVHGGNWNSGKKELYSFFGNNFAKKGIVTVVVGYTLSPEASYKEMAIEIAQAIKWTKSNISDYKGDPEKIFLTGHSAGGHLVALAALDGQYGVQEKDISGIILNDAAGLDMHHYLENNPPTTTDNYLTTWTNDPLQWKDASPINYLSESTPPMLIYVGDKTYESIKVGNKRFLEKLKAFQPKVEVKYINKKHIPMMTQYFWSWNNRYKEIINFINSNS